MRNGLRDGEKTRRPSARACAGATSALAVLAFAGCSDEFRPEPPLGPGPSHPGGGIETRGVEIETLAVPRVTYDASNGKTTVVVQFIAREADGAPLGPGEIIAELLVNDLALDNESILSADAEELSASVHLGLVLDTSYSMLQHDPPAFDPMLEAARNALVEGAALYVDRPGSFTWSLAWFDEGIYVPSSSWAPGDILSIPRPPQGTATKLFGAVEFQAKRMLGAHDSIANGPNDHHVLVVFSDGADNYSWFDNSGTSSTGTTTNGSGFAFSGYPATTLGGATAAIDAHPALTTHVIGLGSDVNDADLTAIAEAGEGRYFKNLASNDVGTLFDQVVQEFATIQDRGATIPLPPGDYTFTLVVVKAVGAGSDTFTFAFHAGDESAGVLD